MVKKRKTHQQQQKNDNVQYDQKDAVTLKDQLGSDVLEKLKLAKSSLTKEIEDKEAERQAKLAFERKQKEKNMSFEELLEKYGDSGSKF